MKNIKPNLIIIGDDVENTGIESSVRMSGCQDEVWFYGPCYDENKLGNLFYNADICVSPGNVGLTAVHSLMYGTPVITHNNFTNQGPEFEVIVEGITGDFFKEDDVSSLSDTIEKWIAKSSLNREDTRINAYKTIDERYNPHIQIKVLKKQLT